MDDLIDNTDVSETVGLRARVEEKRVDGKLVGYVIHWADEQGHVEHHHYTAERKLIRIEPATG
jgi:hypothetical protein